MLRTHEPASDIKATTPIEKELNDSVEWFSPEPEDALDLFQPEVSPNAAAAAARAVRRSALQQLELDSATVEIGSPSNRPAQRNTQLAWDLPYERTDRHLQGSQPSFKSPSRTRTLVWLLLGAPVAVSLVSWFPADAESARRTASDATDRIRSAITLMADRTSLALQSGLSSTLGPFLPADRLEPIAASPSTRNDRNFSPEPTAEPPGYTSPAIEATTPPPTPALSGAQALPRAAALLAGTLTIDSRPVGASVFVDGQPVGTTPVLLPDIQPGIHVVRLQLAAHQEWLSTVQVVPDDRNRVTAALEKDENAPGP
jgi:hypothetical protein